jgi:hypothetical protein
MKYLSWRGNTLYCSYPVPGKPERYSLEIRTTGSATDRARCEREGERALASLRTQTVTGKFFDIEKEAPKIYNPTFRRLCRRYVCNHLRFQKSGRNEIYHLMHAYRHFGKRIAKEITRDDINSWRQKMVRDRAAINTVNNRFAYLGAVYAWANSEDDLKKRLYYDPTTGMKKNKKLPGGNVRKFVLTAEKFERNYAFLRDGQEAKEGTRKLHATPWAVTPCPRFAMFYLALWETGRRPNEVSQYTWDMVHEQMIDGIQVHAVSVPPAITKTDEGDTVFLSDRLWKEVSQLGYRQGFIFRNAEGERWKHWNRHKAKLQEKFGIDAGWIRDTRRGFVTHKCEVEGHDPAHVKACSGHKTDSIFNRYRIGKIRNIGNVIYSAFPPDFRQNVKTA